MRRSTAVGLVSFFGLLGLGVWLFSGDSPAPEANPRGPAAASRPDAPAGDVPRLPVPTEPLTSSAGKETAAALAAAARPPQRPTPPPVEVGLAYSSENAQKTLESRVVIPFEILPAANTPPRRAGSPLVFRDVSRLELGTNERRFVEDLRTRFLAQAIQLGAASPQPEDPRYLDAWLQLVGAADDEMRALVGEEIINALSSEIR